MPADSTTRDRAYFAARSIVRQWGRLTARHRAEPSFIIVGAQRCGTTSMYKTLCQHPGVLPAVLHKGVHYFDTNFQRGRGWYLAHFPTTADLNRHEYGGQPAITGESSPYYMFHPHGAARIAATLPSVRVLVMVRDPIERAYSAHTHESARGFEDLPFDEAIEQEEERTGAEYERMVADPEYSSFEVQHHSYIARGRYARQLRSLSKELGRDRVHVVDSGRFFSQPEQEMPAVLEFLGLPPFETFTFERHNARPRTSLSGQLRARLEAEFGVEDESLIDWLGRQPSWKSDQSSPGPDRSR